MLIEKTDITVNLEQIRKDLEQVLAIQDWPESEIDPKLPRNQICLNHREGSTDPWLEGNGSLRDSGIAEKDFCIINDNVPEYTRTVLENLAKQEGVTFGRIRYMRLLPKVGLSVHVDNEYRYHLVLKTNRFAMFGHVYEGDEELGKVYHIPADGYFYKVDTRLGHFVYNGGWEDRIHLVICVVE